VDRIRDIKQHATRHTPHDVEKLCTRTVIISMELRRTRGSVQSKTMYTTYAQNGPRRTVSVPTAHGLSHRGHTAVTLGSSTVRNALSSRKSCHRRSRIATPDNRASLAGTRADTWTGETDRVLYDDVLVALAFHMYEYSGSYEYSTAFRQAFFPLTPSSCPALVLSSMRTAS
jgi:hypothetical protein